MSTISVIMPALNEETAITGAVYNVLQSFRRLEISGEIVIMNDGSVDRTGEIADALVAKHPEVRVIHHQTPHGIGASFWEGCNVAKCDVITMLPGDGENDSYEILRYLPLLDHVDIVVPFVYNREVRSFQRRAVSKLYKAIINVTFGLLLNYMNGTVMYRRTVLQSLDLKSRGFFYQTELLIKAIRRGYLYAEVPYALSKRGDGKSKALALGSLLKLTRDYFVAIRAVYFRKTGRDSIVENSATERRQALLRETSTEMPVGSLDTVRG